jgi:hypothetical protein
VTVKKLPPHRRLRLQQNDLVLVIGMDPGNPAGLCSLARVYGTAQAAELIDFLVVEAPSELKGEEAVCYMAGHAPLEVDKFFHDSAAKAMTRLKWSGNRIVVLLVVEGQGVWKGTTGNPADILKLANMAGSLLSALAAVSYLNGLREVEVVRLRPLPEEWKGVSKPMQQGRSWLRVGVTLDRLTLRGGKKESDQYYVPRGTRWDNTFNDSAWKHLGDALGIGLWGMEAAWPF